MNHALSIYDENIVLEPMDEKTSELYRMLRNREDNSCFFFSNKPISMEQQRDWFNGYLKNANQYMFAIRERITDLFIGGIGIYDIDFEDGRCEVGRIIIDRNLAGGKGYGARAISLVIKIAKMHLKISTFDAFIYKDNYASICSFLNAGFKEDPSFGDEKIVKMICSSNSDL